MAYTKSQLSQMSTSAQYIADENAKLAQSPKCFIIPPQFYVQLNATFVDLPLIINVQACNVYCNVNTGPGTAAGKFTPIIKGQRMIEWPVGITQAILHVDLAGTGVEGTYFDVTLSDIQPPKMPVPEYSNVTFRVYFSAVRSAGIPLSYQKVWETDFVTSYSDVSLLGCDPVTGNPTLRGMVNQERWQFGGDDVIFMMPNEVCVGQTNGCGADPWRTRTDPVTGTGTVRALRTEWVPNTANGGASLRVIDGHGNDSSTQTRVPVINNTHRSGGQFCTMTTMVYRWGYLECETWQPYTGGTWMTAFWLLPIYNDAGTTLYEIDVGENRVPDWQQSQTDAGFAYHFYNYADRRAYKVLNAALRGIVLPLGNNLYNRWIRYGLLWDVDKIAFYIDGQKVAECPNLISSDFMHVILMQRTFGGTSNASFPGAEILFRKMELWQSADPADKQWLWKNEVLPVSRSGYRWDPATISPLFAISNAGLTCTIFQVNALSGVVQNCMVRTVGNCATNQKKFAAVVAGYDQCIGFHPAGMQMMNGWSGFSSIPHAALLCRAGQIHSAKAASIANGLDICGEGDTLECAIDRANNKIWFRVTPFATGIAGNWNGIATDNPATNSGGVSIAGIFPTAGLVFFGAEMYPGPTSKGQAVNLVAMAPPSGFSAF
jgi:hypothetical protein